MNRTMDNKLYAKELSALFALALETNLCGGYFIFLDFAGHTNQVDLRIKDKYKIKEGAKYLETIYLGDDSHINANTSQQLQNWEQLLLAIQRGENINKFF